MKEILLSKMLLSVSAVITLGCLPGVQAFAQQTPDVAVKRNSPFAPNPKKKVEPKIAQSVKPDQVGSPEKVVNIPSSEQQKPTGMPALDIAQPKLESAQIQNAVFQSPSIAKKTLEVARRGTVKNALPTDIYKVGVGDILFIGLQNAPAKESTYFTILKDGTIDYPLAGEMVSVLGMTTDEIESLLQDKIKLYENPEISVKVREHNSHTFSVLGMVDKPGEKFMQREAMPLYVIRAEALVQPKANQAVIKRVNSQTETIDLKDEKYENVLVYPGDIVEFDSSELTKDGQPQYYYVGKGVESGGQKEFHQGITLTQAILVAGGLKKDNAKSVTIRHKNEAGMLVPTVYDLKAIKDAKIADPVIQPDDTIEIGN